MNAIVWVLDSSDHSTFQTAQAELHALLDKPELRGIPLLVSQAALEAQSACTLASGALPLMDTQVLANKNDLPDHASVDEVIKALALSTITNREVSCYSISGKSSRPLTGPLFRVAS